MQRRLITAKYNSACYECGGIILRGDQVVYDGEVVWCTACDTKTFEPDKKANEDANAFDHLFEEKK